MRAVRLVYFEGCPNLDEVRSTLRAMPELSVEEVNQSELPADDPLRCYSSPSILMGERIMFGAKTDSADGGCSYGKPDAAVIRALLEESTSRSRWIAPVASLLPLIAGSFCPACIPPLAAFLSAIGIGIFAQERMMSLLYFGGIGVTMVGLVWSYAKVHRNPCPLIAAGLMVILLILERFANLSDITDSVFLYGGGIGLMVVTLWNLRMKAPCGCTKERWDCLSCFFPKRTREASCE